jgi:predicted ATP-grasp superfamily ATP-dependent carboligase
MTPAPRALIVDPGNSRGSLAAVRALARAGWTVGVGGTDTSSLAASSRRCRWWEPVPPAADGIDHFMQGVAGAVSRRGYEVVLPAGDAETLALSRVRDRIDACVPYPDHAVVARAFDKALLAEAAGDAGIAVPSTTLVARGAAVPPFSPPAVVKERVHAGTDRSGGDRVEALVATTERAATRRVSEIHATGGDALLQELARGRLIAYTSVMSPDGSVLAAVEQEAERIFPPDAGASARARTVPVDPGLAERVERLLRGLGWWGLAQLQFLRPDGGEPRLIDFNGRLYGSLALALAAGANLPALWAAVATDRPARPAAPAAVGVRYQWLEGDLRVATGERGARLVGEVIRCLRYGAGARHAIWSAADPLPQVRDGVRLVREESPNLRRLARKLVR